MEDGNGNIGDGARTITEAEQQNCDKDVTVLFTTRQGLEVTHAWLGNCFNPG